MVPLLEPTELLRWTATTFDARPEVVETTLTLPTPTFLALETAARQHHMTVGQMVRVLIGRGLAGGVLPADDRPTSSG